MKGKHQYSNLDGVRGLAAFSVLLLHYVTAFAPFLIGYVVTRRHTPLDHWIATTPLQLPVAGNLAVCVFFVLSGFVLSIKFFKLKTTDVLVSSAVRRYFRLMIPTLGSIILAYLILRLGGIHTQKTAIITESSNWLAQSWNFPARLGQALYQGIYGVFVTSFTSYNVVLWTMHFELFGSFIVFMFLALFGKLPNRWIFYGLFSLVFLKTYYLGFLAGVAISDVVINYPDIRENLNEKLVWSLLVFGLILGSWPTSSIYPSLYNQLHLPLFNQLQLAIFAHTIGAMFIIIAVLRLDILSRFFESRPLQFLGKISYSLYLIHFIILSSLACYIFNTLMPHFGYSKSVIFSFIPSVIVTLVLANLYTIYVDERAIAASKSIGELLAGKSILNKLRKSYKKSGPISIFKRIPAQMTETLPVVEDSVE